MKLEIEARFDETDDTYVSMGEIIPESGEPQEFVLAGEWVRVEFDEVGAQLRVEEDKLTVPFDGQWHEGKLLGVLVRGRLSGG